MIESSEDGMKDDAILADLPLWSDPETNKIFEELCEQEEISSVVIKELISLQRDYQHMERARGIYDDIDDILSRGEC